jgi:predicted transcriptional regulator
VSHLAASFQEFVVKTKEFDLAIPSPAIQGEDEKTLPAIDEGIHDAEAGRTITIEKVRKRLHEWITASLSRKGARRFRRNSDL